MKDHKKKLRIIWFSCSGAPFGAEILERLRKLDPVFLDDILLVVLSKSKLNKPTDQNAGETIRTSPSSIFSALQWRVNNALFKLGTIYRRFKSVFISQSFRRIEDFCLQYNKRTHITRDVNNDNTAKIISELQPDLIIMTTFHHILKPAIFDIPKMGAFNVHPSCLPEYKGPDPINAVIRDGARETGVTLHEVDSGIDTGKIISQRKVNLTRAIKEKQLRGILAPIAAELLIDHFKRLQK